MPVIGYQEIDVSGFSAEETGQIHESAAHANDEHGDTVRLIARYGLGERRDVWDAQFVAVDPHGMDIAVVDASGQRDRLRLTFPSPATMEMLVPHLIAAMTRARQAAPPDEPMTLLEEELAEDASRQTLITSVARVRDLSPNVREITFSGGLERYATRGAAEFVNIYVPRPGYESALTPGLAYEDIQALAEDARPDVRNFTTRAWRPDTGELDVWFMLHGQPSRFASWVHAARPGDVAGIRGPRVHLNPPPGTTRVVCLGDETFLPATAAVLDHLDATIPVDVLLETRDAAHEVALPDRPGSSVRWVHRGSQPSGESIVLLDGVRELNLDPRHVYVCGGGEASRMAEIRRHLRAERQLASSDVSVVGYWRKA
ncbi:MAG: SIP domain-containing protein [Dehalococcoidia bacterium]